jgi:hypothetical protein
MGLVRKARDRRNLDQRCLRADDLSEGAARPDLGTERCRGGSVQLGKAAGQGCWSDPVHVGPAIETTARIAYYLLCQQIRPIVNDRKHFPQLRFQDLNRDLQTAFGRSSDRIQVAHATSSVAVRDPGEREIQDRRASWLVAIQMRIKGVVKQYVAGPNTEPAPVTGFLIPPGQDHGSISTRMGMSGLHRLAVVLFAASGDRSEGRNLASVAQWIRTTGLRKNPMMQCYFSTPSENIFRMLSTSGTEFWLKFVSMHVENITCRST